LDLLEAGGEDTHIVATANSTEMVRSLVAMGTGVSLLNMRPRSVPAYADKSICCIPVTDSTHGITLSLGCAPGPKRRLLQLFIDSCTEYFQGPASADLTVSDNG
jgi:DNA-binding transcriptional LysR family regulator